MKKGAGMRLEIESLEQLKILADKNKRSMANMVEILIQNEYNKIEKENETMDECIECGKKYDGLTTHSPICGWCEDKIIEHLQEMGKVCVDSIKHVKALMVRLQDRGYPTQFIVTDRDYLVLDK